MSKGNVEYFWEYNMITGGKSTTERCVTGMIQNDKWCESALSYVFHKMNLSVSTRSGVHILYLVYSITECHLWWKGRIFPRI